MVISKTRAGKLLNPSKNSFMITLPLEWIQKNNLKYGNRIEYDIMSNGDLIVRKKKELFES